MFYMQLAFFDFGSVSIFRYLIWEINKSEHKA
jgi:hypothetical protein